MIVKLMSAAHAGDDDSRKPYRLFADVTEVDFERRDGDAFAHMVLAQGKNQISIQLRGNAYVMNDAGKTISSFGIADLH